MEMSLGPKHNTHKQLEVARLFFTTSKHVIAVGFCQPEPRVGVPLVQMMRCLCKMDKT